MIAHGQLDAFRFFPIRKKKVSLATSFLPSDMQTFRKLLSDGIVVMGHNRKGLAEEAPDAYKDVNEVVEVMHASGIAMKVAKVRPLICVKG